MKNCSIILLLAVTAAMLWPAMAQATPEYAGRSGQGCKACHTEGAVGGRLTEAGLEFAASGYVWPPAKGYRVLGPIRKPVRFIIGVAHITGAFIWFGAILYVHMLLKPAYAEKGLPKGEVRLGLFSMFIVGLSGVLLTISRIKSLDVLYTSPWGKTLSVKIAIYLVMTGSALMMVLFVGPKLRKGAVKAQVPKNGVFDPATLSAYDGQDKRPAYIAFKETVYDVTGLRLWANGKHMTHLAGKDLTDAIKNAPHGKEKLSAVPVLGRFDPTAKPSKTLPQKVFFFVAYMNLSLVFVVLLTLGWWRWGL